MPAQPTSDVPSEGHLEGTIIRSTGSWYAVEVGNRIVPSKVRGKFRLSDREVTNPVAVGDRVTIRLNPDETGLIVDIHARTNKLSRRAAGRKAGVEHVIVANVDAAWLIQSVRLPRPNTGLIDRFLVMAEYHQIEGGIVLNKMDLLTPDDTPLIGEIVDLYRTIGYPVVCTSTVTGEGMDEYRALLKDATSVIAGPSGVGKSSLLNRIAPGLEIPTQTVSNKTRKGRHTTTHAALHPLPGGGRVVDTPGIREFGIVDVPADDLDLYFVEFQPFIEVCRFPNCTHDHEPDCAVRDAVDAGEIAEMRYESYLNILFSIQQGTRDVGR